MFQEPLSYTEDVRGALEVERALGYVPLSILPRQEVACRQVHMGGRGGDRHSEPGDCTGEPRDLDVQEHPRNWVVRPARRPAAARGLQEGQQRCQRSEPPGRPARGAAFSRGAAHL